MRKYHVPIILIKPSTSAHMQNHFAVADGKIIDAMRSLVFSWQKINVFHLSFDLQLSSFHVRAWFAGIKADGVGEGGCYERTIRSAKFFGMAMKV